MILLLPPGFPVEQSIKDALKLHGLTKAEEIEPKAGCRRFLLT